MYRKVIKPFLDWTLAFGLLVILLGPMIVIAILVKVTSPGPVLFQQKRFGKGNKVFKIYKFRTMVQNSPEVANQQFDNMGDYMTPLGHVMRATSIDELPQLLNILKLQMSFIGPRPLAKTDMKVIELRTLNHANQLRPGITGLAQVNGRNNVTDEQKASFDAKYLELVSFSWDVKILVQTIKNVIRRKDINKSRYI